MKSIRIVSHCWAGENTQYAGHLRYQLSSLVLFKPKAQVTMVVCYDPIMDPLTKEVLEDFQHVKQLHLGVSALGRRSIGRNIAALDSTEDLVWFADCDYVFGAGCVDSVISAYEALDEPKPALVYPYRLKIQNTHEEGDKSAAQSLAGEDAYILPEWKGFMDYKYSRAIGGVQVVSGEYARTYGYLNGHKRFQTPRVDGKVFGDFRDDVAFRRFATERGGCKRIETENLYRMRHTSKTY